MLKRRRTSQKRPYAKRLDKRLEAERPGSVVQVDTLFVRTADGRTFRQFTALDVKTKTRVTNIYSSGSSNNARRFLLYIDEKLPFKIENIQVDGGSEFKGEFEKACQKARIPLHVNPPRCPKMNAYVERCHRTIRQEFYYSRDDLPSTVLQLRAYLEQDDYWYNWLRPHQALDNQPPMLKFLSDSRSFDAPLSEIQDAPSHNSSLGLTCIEPVQGC